MYSLVHRALSLTTCTKIIVARYMIMSEAMKFGGDGKMLQVSDIMQFLINESYTVRVIDLFTFETSRVFLTSSSDSIACLKDFSFG